MNFLLYLNQCQRLFCIFLTDGKLKAPKENYFEKNVVLDLFNTAEIYTWIVWVSKY